MTTEKSFTVGLPLILEYEGGYVNNPNDKGGPTNKGIIQKEYDTYRKTKNLPIQSVKFIQDSEVADIYLNEYWIAGCCDKLPYPINLVHFDTCVNCGNRQAAKFMQRTVGAIADGAIGQKTLNSVDIFLKTKKMIDLINGYLQYRSNFYYGLVEKDPSQKVFIVGWQNRIKKLTTYVLSHPAP
jgi:lysozyme family protein